MIEIQNQIRQGWQIVEYYFENNYERIMFKLKFQIIKSMYRFAENLNDNNIIQN